MVDAADRTNWSTLKLASCCWSSSSSSGVGVSSATDPLPRLHLLGIDLLQARSFVAAGDLPLRSVPLGHGEERGGADLVGDRCDPLEELLDPGTRRDRLTALEVEQLAAQPVADR